ncbi:uncharacterized protein LOC129918868 [Episyrphus balteatus]|uniref:uncharacterized protein LOC129918868 n=1 Tax=Episyrphus balteatus TaxID=286459 RepID=UPI002484E781|nr:uncharacterized protein LOC129918868 [Episyrphus balteatus]
MSTKIVDLYERKIAILIEDLCLWVLSQPHLNSRIDDEFLRGFLRSCRYDLNETKIHLDTFYTFKNTIPSILTERNVNKKILDICQMGISVFLPVSLNDKDVRLNFTKYPLLPRSSTFTYADVIKLFFMLAEVNMIESRNSDPQAAVVYVIDLDKSTFRQSLKIDISFSKNISQFIQNGLPLQIDEVHFINVSKYFKCILRMACSFLNADLKKKFHAHSSMDTFYKYVPQEFLPIEYGGKNGNIATCIKRQMESLVKFEQYFEEDVMYGVNEFLRRK